MQSSTIDVSRAVSLDVDTEHVQDKHVTQLANVLRGCVRRFDMSRTGAFECVFECGYDCFNQCGTPEFSKTVCCITCVGECVERRQRELDATSSYARVYIVVLVSIVSALVIVWLVAALRNRHSRRPRRPFGSGVPSKSKRK